MLHGILRGIDCFNSVLTRLGTRRPCMHLWHARPLLPSCFPFTHPLHTPYPHTPYPPLRSSRQVPYKAGAVDPNAPPAKKAAPAKKAPPEKKGKKGKGGKGAKEKKAADGPPADEETAALHSKGDLFIGAVPGKARSGVHSAVHSA